MTVATSATIPVAAPPFDLVAVSLPGLDWLVLFYFVGMFVLFFFWIYGIVSFVLDVKNRVIPGLKQYRRGRNSLEEEDERERTREENERQLY